jgi:hypothetical protein
VITGLGNTVGIDMYPCCVAAFVTLWCYQACRSLLGSAIILARFALGSSTESLLHVHSTEMKRKCKIASLFSLLRSFNNIAFS